jgi:hypothetical protein
MLLNLTTVRVSVGLSPMLQQHGTRSIEDGRQDGCASVQILPIVDQIAADKSAIQAQFESRGRTGGGRKGTARLMKCRDANTSPG